MARTYRCPDTPREGVEAASDIIGCGRTFTVDADNDVGGGSFDGMIDCPHCGMAFRPEQGGPKTGDTRTFHTPHDQLADREGQRVSILRVIDVPDDDHDDEVLPMYRVRFADGYETDAWPDEVATAE